jgi:hypothetical protein
VNSVLVQVRFMRKRESVGKPAKILQALLKN